MKQPLFSIIVACLNEEDRIAATINSILAQSFTDYEILVKDGYSQDSTLQRIPNDSRIHVHQQQDSSVYDAMNQGFAKASGSFIMFLNCGDTLYDATVLEAVARHIDSHTLDTHSVIYGDVCVGSRILQQHRHITRKTLIREGLCHQSIFMGCAVLQELGGFDTSLQLCADYDAIVHAYINRATYSFVDTVICRYAGGGISERDNAIAIVKREGRCIKKRYFTAAERLSLLITKITKRLG